MKGFRESILIILAITILVFAAREAFADDPHHEHTDGVTNVTNVTNKHTSKSKIDAAITASGYHQFNLSSYHPQFSFGASRVEGATGFSLSAGKRSGDLFFNGAFSIQNNNKKEPVLGGAINWNCKTC